MKRFTIPFFILLFAISAQAQLKIGAHVGLILGDYDDAVKTDLGADVYYMFGPDILFQVGAATGYFHYLGDDITAGGVKFESDDYQFIPLAGAARLSLLGILKVGADVGWAFGINDGNDGGFYWRGLVGIGLLGILEVNAYYKSIHLDSPDVVFDIDGALGSLGIGVVLTL